MTTSKVCFICDTCGEDGTKQFDDVMELKKHALEVHGVDLNMVKGTRRMMSHMDGSDWYSTVYEWEFGDELTITQSVVCSHGR